MDQRHFSDWDAEVATSAVNKSNNSSKDDQHHLNIIVKNLPYDKREENDNSILFSKVAGLMTDGLKFTNIGIKNVIRKTNRSDSKPGIVVISFENLVKAIVKKFVKVFKCVYRK